MQYTSAQANKLVKKLMEKLDSVRHEELQNCKFVAATMEDPEDARPPYDYADTQRRISELEAKIRKVKHCLNVFNTTHKPEGFDMTVDQLLIYIPQLSERKSKLANLSRTLAKKRVDTTARSLIEYQYANYDVAAAKADYEAVCAELTNAQLALDKMNTTETMEIDLD